MRPCFTFKAKADEASPVVLALDDEIGFWGTDAKDFRAGLDAVTGDELVVEINSPGGEVFAGLGMHNMIRNWASKEGRSVTTRVTGIAASIASIVALAGDKREMPRNAFAMIHSVSSFAWGTAEELREAADVTDKIQGSLRQIYVDRMGVDEVKATEIMSKDTWLTAEECLEMGFATELTDAVQATAKFDMERADLPANVKAVFKAKTDDVPPVPKDDPAADTVDDQPLAEQIVAKAKEAGLEAYAKVFALAHTDMASATARIDRSREIVALCNLAGRPDDAKKAIKADKPVAEVRAALVQALADDDKDIDGSPPVKKDPPENRQGGNGAPVNSTALWASHHAQTAQKKEGR